MGNVQCDASFDEDEVVPIAYDPNDPANIALCVKLVGDGYMLPGPNYPYS
jgi:ribosomal protein L2